MSNKIPPQPEVLVIIPTLGERIEYLRLALESIRAQKSVKFEIMLVFPLKNRLVTELAKEFNATIIDDPGSMSSALNKGIESANSQHKYIVWMGDDDILHPGSLLATYTAMESRPRSVVAFGYCDYIDSNGKYIFSSRAGRLAPWLMTWGPNLVPMMGLMFRRSSFDEVGGFDTKLKYAMDLDLLLKLRKKGEFVNTKKTLSSFRWHATSQTVSNRPKVLAETKIIKRKYLSKFARSLCVLWEYPVDIATKIAVRNVNLKAKRAL